MSEACTSALHGNSRRVRSRQRRPHPRLLSMARRHLESPWRQPLHGPSVAAFGQVSRLLGAGEIDRLVLDSGCGTGDSTWQLADHHPRSVVIGIDKSLKRLAKQGYGAQPLRKGRVLWVRAELATFWRLALDHGWRVKRHYLLYPNPWPRPAQVMRRWHAHPAFSPLLKLGGDIEMRCNWRVYAEEFAAVAGYATGIHPPVEQWSGRVPLTPHERKYLASGHELFRVVVRQANRPVDSADPRHHGPGGGPSVDAPSAQKR